MRVEPIPERRESEDMQTKNSPFFKMSQPQEGHREPK